jgi:hypothetical protein
MRLTYMSAAALVALATACSNGPQDSNTSDGHTTDNTNQISDADMDSDERTTRSSASSPTRPNTNVTPAGTNTNALSSTARPTTNGESQASYGQTTSSRGDQTQDATQADSASQTDPSDATNSSNDASDGDVVDTGADDEFSFFVTSYHHLAELSGNDDGFGGDLRYKGAASGLEGADAICQEIARRVGFGNKRWRAYLSTSTVNAIDRVGNGPWYDFVGASVAESPTALLAGENRQPGGCCEEGTYDELGMFHDGSTDQNNDGVDDDDHDTMTATLEDGTYAGFSCEDWTSVTATDPASSGGGQGGGQFAGGGGGGRGGVMMGHSWPARSGEHWATSHGGHQCAAGTNFVQDGSGDPSTVGGGGGYGGFYCFALAEQ